MKQYILSGMVAISMTYLPPIKKIHNPNFVYQKTEKEIVIREAKINELDPEHLHHTFMQESQYNPLARSVSDAIGCGQLTKHARKYLGLTVEQALDCELSINGAAKWFEKGKWEIGIGTKKASELTEKDKENLSQWYYCGINLYKKRIYDKHYKKTEICGTSYVSDVKRHKGSFTTFKTRELLIAANSQSKKRSKG